MLNRIIRKRTQLEEQAWQTVLSLMPRRRQTRGIQYQVLEYLFAHLYEKVSEEELGRYLQEQRGSLPATGDPVKGAINQAIKELQRLPEPLFELVKIQETQLGTGKRFVRMNFTKFEEVIAYDQMQEYLNDILKGEKHFVLRTVAFLAPPFDNLPFPGLEPDHLNHSSLHAIVNEAARGAVPGEGDYRFLPDCVGMWEFLLVYEHEDAPVPFLGFMSDAGLGGAVEESRCILYRGAEKASKLKFLNALWHKLAARAEA
ncbi:hypothetical protein [Acanthopleuribacter pedis]|uniref:Uncharacterized protein n=1 Tax=Acanthopleuribacter pedis TaxID=442870 RepID=A0A8J7U8N2_9BACT|nr:hypothetical protein [Acanthopleuribacter pedis]MBO1322746.1 hypothetical protein [Acanthopleuribacter pedis]